MPVPMALTTTPVEQTRKHKHKHKHKHADHAKAVRRPTSNVRTRQQTCQPTCTHMRTRPAQQRQLRAAVPPCEQCRSEEGGARGQKQRTPPSALAVPPQVHLQDGI